jgi:hypothetical protein
MVWVTALAQTWRTVSRNRGMALPVVAVRSREARGSKVIPPSACGSFWAPPSPVLPAVAFFVKWWEAGPRRRPRPPWSSPAAFSSRRAQREPKALSRFVVITHG